MTTRLKKSDLNQIPQIDWVPQIQALREHFDSVGCKVRIFCKSSCSGEEAFMKILRRLYSEWYQDCIFIKVNEDDYRVKTVTDIVSFFYEAFIEDEEELYASEINIINNNEADELKIEGNEIFVNQSMGHSQIICSSTKKIKNSLVNRLQKQRIVIVFQHSNQMCSDVLTWFWYQLNIDGHINNLDVIDVIDLDGNKYDQDLYNKWYLPSKEINLGERYEDNNYIQAINDLSSCLNEKGCELEKAKDRAIGYLIGCNHKPKLVYDGLGGLISSSISEPV